MNKIAEKIAGKRQNTSLRVVADEIGISHSTLVRIEKGRAPDLNTFRLICKWLGMSPNELLGYRDHTTPHRHSYTIINPILFYPGDKVKIIEPNIDATVNKLTMDENGILYHCHYWQEACVHDVVMYGHELDFPKIEEVKQ